METEKPEQVDNKRVAFRQRILKSAKIIHKNQWSVVDCSVRDISATGAKIQCDDQMSVPNEIRFLLISDNTIRDAKVAWRRSGFLGIHFTGPPERAPARKF
jgi:PilZ domain